MFTGTDNIWRVMFSIIISGFAFAAQFTYLSGLASDTIPMKLTANQGIHSSLRVANRQIAQTIILIMLLWIAIVIAGWSMLKAFVVLALSGVLFGYATWAIYGGFEVEKHIILRLVLSRLGKIPFHFRRFLDYASSLILLRKVGGGYIFIHRYLLEYFASLDSNQD